MPSKEGVLLPWLVAGILPKNATMRYILQKLCLPKDDVETALGEQELCSDEWYICLG